MDYFKNNKYIRSETKMMSILYKPLISDSPQYSYLDKLYKSTEYIFYSHEMENEKYIVVLILENEKSNRILIDWIIATPYIFNKKKRNSKIPIYFNYSKKIFFFKKNQGNPITDKELILELYNEAWAQEFLYAKPFMQISKSRLDFVKNIYKFNKERLKNFKYPETDKKLDKKTYELSATLDKSDLDLGREYSLFLEIALDCYNISHELSHSMNQKKLGSLRNKFSLIPARIEKIKKINEDRVKIWPEWDLYLKDYISRKVKSKKLFVSFIMELFKIPFLGFVLSLLGSGLENIKDNIMGHKSLQKSIKKYEELIIFTEKYRKELFESDIPKEKLF